MSAVVGGAFEARALPTLHPRLFIEGKGCVAGAQPVSAGLGPGHYLRSEPLGAGTALAVWDVNTRAAALAVFHETPSEHQTRCVVDAAMALGGNLATLRIAVVGGAGNGNLRGVWMNLDKRVRVGALPEAGEGGVQPGPPELYHGERVHLVFNGAASWLGQPDG